MLSSCAGITSIAPSVSSTAALPSHYDKVALLLPLHGSYGGAGTAIRDGYFAAYYDAQSRGDQASSVKIYDTTKSSNIRDLYRQAVADGAQMVIGPLDKDSVASLKSSGHITVPTLALNYTNQRPTQNFFAVGLSPQNQAYQAANKAWSDGHRNAIIIAPQGLWGFSIANAFTKQWQQLGGNIIDGLNYTPNQNLGDAIKNLLHVKQIPSRNSNRMAERRQDADILFLVALSQNARKIVPLLKFYYLGNLPVYSVSLIYDGVTNPAADRDMDGVYFCDSPWIFKDLPKMRLLRQGMAHLWPSPYHNYIRLYALGLDAYLLTQNLNRLDPTGQNAVPGATGKLYLDNQQNIWQVLQWAQFRDGKPYLI